MIYANPVTMSPSEPDVRAHIFVAAPWLGGRAAPSGGEEIDRKFLSHFLQLTFLSFTGTTIFSTTKSSNQNLPVNLYELFKVNYRF